MSADTNGWQPISTAPKDGSEFAPLFGPAVLLATKTGSCAIGYWDEHGHSPAGERGWIGIESHRPLYSQGWTHWQPLPSPPAA